MPQYRADEIYDAHPDFYPFMLFINFLTSFYIFCPLSALFSLFKIHLIVYNRSYFSLLFGSQGFP